MAEIMVPIRSVKGYLKEFIVDGLGKGADKDLIRSQMLDAFHKEIFGQLMLRFGDPEMLARDISTVDPESKRMIDNIISNSVRKWKRLSSILAQNASTHDLIYPSDLMVTLEDVIKSQADARLINGGESDGQ